MRRLTIGALSAAAITGVLAPSAMAEMHGEYSESAAEQLSTEDITAFDLTYLAYRGQLEDYGVPGGNFLIQDFRRGDVTAEEIVETAVEHNYVNDAALQDASYIDRVNDFLQMIENHDAPR